MEFDSRLTLLGIEATRTANAAWALSRADYQDEKESGGNHNIYFAIQDSNGQPLAGVTCVMDWKGRNPNEDPPTKVVSDTQGQANVPIYANLDIGLLNGPYFAFIEDQTKSDVVSGMGLPESRHVNFLLTFVQSTTSPTADLEQAVAAAAESQIWMPVNDRTALYKFAQSYGLGCPQTDEFEFTFNADVYVGQVFTMGIVYVKKGDWSNVQWVKKATA
jgi:hypothetical protein